MYLTDYHIHTNWSHDGRDSMEKIAESAINKNVQEICFTDHFELTEDRDRIDYSNYLLEYEKIKKKYHGKIELRLGIELGILNDRLDGFSKVVNSFPFDYVLASTHRVDNISPSLPKYFDGIDRLESYLKYFKYMHESIRQFDDFDCWAHLDYIIRYGSFEKKGFRYFEIQDILDGILKNLISKGKGIEINSSYRLKNKKEFHPSREILKRYFELGGEIISFGSDAHTKENIAIYWKEARELLSSLDQNYLSIFKNRKVDFIKI
ncbi:histidinol-phosphatase HisJ family protein [uncultured Ilyobacter sp.]|uniref:histidinol-phosphatase HisJ family protein n=1 Tax=uncultured Ilyobacter sp. TaxID=544433 RepID=UPI0029F4DF2F|nr:histidinol-phosphatase HisJ family protein [uncultured Ilyobacter sp.]